MSTEREDFLLERLHAVERGADELQLKCDELEARCRLAEYQRNEYRQKNSELIAKVQNLENELSLALDDLSHYTDDSARGDLH